MKSERILAFLILLLSGAALSALRSKTVDPDGFSR
jgi:hypothetical protein